VNMLYAFTPSSIYISVVPFFDPLIFSSNVQRIPLNTGPISKIQIRHRGLSACVRRRTCVQSPAATYTNLKDVGPCVCDVEASFPRSATTLSLMEIRCSYHNNLLRCCRPANHL